MAIPNSTKVTARIGRETADAVDAGTAADLIYADSGDVKITPVRPGAKFTDGAEKIWVGFETYDARIGTDGRLTWNGQPSIDVYDLTDERFEPYSEEDKATHVVRFYNVKAAGKPITISERPVRISGATANLIDLMPAELSKGVFLTKGDPGEDGQDGSNVVPTNTAVRTTVTGDLATPGSAIETAFSANYAQELLSAAAMKAVADATRILRSADDERATPTPDGRTTTMLATGQANQAWSKTGCTESDDTIRFKNGTQSKRFTTTGAGTATARLDPINPTGPDPITFPPASIVRAWVWLDSAEFISSIGIEIYGNEALSSIWNRTTGNLPRPLKTGWNLLSWNASAGSTTDWGNAYRVRVVAVATSATSFNVGGIWVESPPKAQILFIEDRGYQTFVDNGLADLRSRKIPVTWALDPDLNGANPGTKAQVVTDSQIQTFYSQGDDLSIHSYDGAVTSTKTAREIRDDTLKAQRWLYDRDYTNGSQWRAAWTQNSAPNHTAAQPYYAAYATPTSASSLTAWPFVQGNRYNVPRVALHGLTPTVIDATFSTLQKTNSLFVCYTHGIHTDGGNDMTPTQWAYFLGKLDAAISAGWLEGVTFSRLLERGGGTLRA